MQGYPRRRVRFWIRLSTTARTPCASVVGYLLSSAGPKVEGGGTARRTSAGDRIQVRLTGYLAGLIADPEVRLAEPFSVWGNVLVAPGGFEPPTKGL